VPPTVKSDYGYEVGSGIKTNTVLGSLLLSYEWKPNFLSNSIQFSRNESPEQLYAESNTAVIYFGVRWNMQRRDFEF
jgi:hypothetical protein